VRVAEAASDVVDRCRASLPRLREGQFFSHGTAAGLWGVPMRTPFDPSAPVHVSSFAPARPPRTRGVIGHELRPGGVRVVERHGLPVADAASTWLQLGCLLSVDELVVAGDHLVLDPVVLDLLDPRPYVGLGDLAAALHAYRGRGRRALLEAVGSIRPGAESRPETLLRLLLVRAGLPEPRVNFVVEDPGGRFIARVDLAYPQLRVAVEYDGDHHRTSTSRYEHDIARFDRLHDAGWRVVRVRSRGLFRFPDETLARVRRARGRRVRVRPPADSPEIDPYP
jgi:very-short-patch-repair endonuclease